MAASMAQGGAHMARAARSLGTQRRALAPVRVGAPAPRRASAPRARSLATAPVARTETLFLEPGFKAPAFALAEPATGKTVDLYTYAAGAPATVVMIICNHCPFVVHLKPAIAQLAADYAARGVKFVAINSNDPTAKEGRDAPEKMVADAEAYGFPYLFDESQEVAKRYQAMCTPEFMVFDKDMGLAYHGQFDDTRPSTKGGDGRAPDGADLRAALDATLAGKATGKWKASIGCSVKWREGNAPSYYG